jgi:indole-3-glycerol phosphate synthase
MEVIIMNILDKIIEDKRIEINKRKRDFPIPINNVEKINKDNSFISAIKKKGISIISEIKRKSPSAGIIREDFNHIKIAKDYEGNGACAISVLTDNRYFGGELSFISDIKDKVNIPVLRKEFIIDEYQIYESIIAGADAILLIVKALSIKEIKRLVFLAKKLGLETLVEVHSLEELDIALSTNTSIIGINNRNLDTMKVDITTSLKLIEEIPSNYLTVSESGIRSFRDIKILKHVGFDAFLIGESLMKEKNPSEKLKSLLGKK